VQRKAATPCSTCATRAVRASVVASQLLPRGGGKGVIQRIQAEVYRNGNRIGQSPQQGGGGVPGQSHAEQKAWQNAGAPQANNGDIIKFVVDGPICAGCTAWFENTLYPLVHARGATLMVHVDYNDYYGSIMVTGPGTVWGKVSEAGYFQQGGLAGDRQVARALAPFFK
jgi:hypothetical protein